ncbi:hypothetical protein C8K58_11448 [Pseudomonas sp. GV047]|nr:hypothetical protein C8K58_11448 [Pseudomonas sp. GV047]
MKITNTPPLWGWLFGFCLILLVGCSILSVDAHNTVNEYKAMKANDLTMIRQEIVNASLAQSNQLRTLINNNSEQLKQYVDVQIPREVHNSFASYTPITINQTANPAMTTNPTLNNSNSPVGEHNASRRIR